MEKHVLPKGFLAGGLHCGLKRKKRDLALFYSAFKCEWHAIFTKNSVKAAPLIVGIRQLKRSRYLRAVIVNSGNANCMTGKRGIKDAETMARCAAKALSVRKSEVFVSSTGVIGKPLNIGLVKKNIPGLAGSISESGIQNAAEGISTTDRFNKIRSKRFDIGGSPVTITGTAKGAGMVNPDMATILCYLMTDANISRSALKSALKETSRDSFNSITVDGDMSTNDTVLIMANGAAGNRVIKKEKGKGGGTYAVFRENLKEIMLDLAKMIVADGEGATKLIEVKVTGAKDYKEARQAAAAVSGSILVKCAALGGDPNWGRVGSSLGASGIDFDIHRIQILLDGVVFFNKGEYTSPDDERRSSVFKKKEVSIEVRLGRGKAEAVVYTCDISKAYISFNSVYTT